MLNSYHACKTKPPTKPSTSSERLVHLSDESVDLVLTVTQVTALDEVAELAVVEAAIRVGQREGPQEVGGLLEVGADGVDLVDEILHAHDAVLAEVLLNNRVVGQRDALLVDLAVAALVDELAHGLQVRVTVRHPRLDDLEHLKGGLGQADEDTAVDLDHAQQLQDLARLRSNLVDTAKVSAKFSVQALQRHSPLDTDNEDESVLSRDVEGAILLCETGEADLLALVVAVLLDVLLSTLEDDATLLLLGLLHAVSQSPTRKSRQQEWHGRYISDPKDG